MKHFQTSSSAIVVATLDWTRQNFVKQISLSPIMRARYHDSYLHNAHKDLIYLKNINHHTKLFMILKVTYQTDTFLDKNRDYIVVEHRNLLSSSKCSFVSGLFPSVAEETSRSSYKFSSVASRFKVYAVV